MSVFGVVSDGEIVSRIRDGEVVENEITISRIPTIPRDGFTYTLHVKIPQPLGSEEGCIKKLSGLFRKTDPGFIAGIESGKFSVETGPSLKEPEIRVRGKRMEPVSDSDNSWYNK